MQLGPTRRSPAARAVASSAAWARAAVRVHLAEAGREDHRGAARRARRARRSASGTAGAGRLTSARSIPDGSASTRRHGRAAEDRLAGRVDGVERAGDSRRSFTFCEQAVAELGGVARDAEHGHGGRREQRARGRSRPRAAIDDADGLARRRARSCPAGRGGSPARSASRSCSSRRSRALTAGSQPGIRLDHERHPVAAAVGVEHDLVLGAEAGRPQQRASRPGADRSSRP